MFGDSPMDYMGTDELARRTDAVRHVAARRRQDNVNNLESCYAALIVVGYDQTVGRYNKGVVLLRRDEHYPANLARVYECLEKAADDGSAADAIRALGFPVLKFTGLDPANPCTLIPVLGQLGECRTATVKETGCWKSEAPNFSNIPRQKVKADQILDYAPDQTFLCQHCHKEYRYGKSTSTAPHCFCTGLCQVEYKRTTGREFPPVGGEIPLGVGGVCNLGGMDVTSDAWKSFEEGLRHLGNRLAHGDRPPSCLTLDSIQREATEPSAIRVETAEEARAALTSLRGAELHGTVRLSSGHTIPAPSAGCYWFVDGDGTLVERQARANNIVEDDVKRP